MPAAYKIWKLGDPTDTKQTIDHLWTGNPTAGQCLEDCDHYAKIEIYGSDRLAVATDIIALLNERDARAREPARSRQADVDRAIVLLARDEMGSLAVASLDRILGLEYGRGGFEEALKDASRTQLDRLLEKAKPYLG